MPHQDGDPGFVGASQAIEASVEPDEDADLAVTVGIERLQQGGAQGRGQAERQERRKQNRHGHGQGELAIDHPDRSPGERHGNEDRRQDQGDPDDRSGDFAYRGDRRVLGREPLGRHQALDVLHHHDGVVDDDADRQNHAEHRQHVDGKARHQHDGERSQQRDRRHDRRNQRVADVLQKQQHHQEHQRHGFDQGVDHLFDRNLDEWRGIERRRIAHARRHRPAQLGQTCLDAFGGAHGVGARRQLHGGKRRDQPVLAVDEPIALGPQFHARDVAERHLGTVAVAAQNDGREFLGRLQLALHGQRNGDPLSRHGGRRADMPGSDLRVLLHDGRRQIVHGQAEGDQLRRIDPDAHRLFGAEELHPADAIDATQFLDDVAGQIVAQRRFVETVVVRFQADHHQKPGVGGFHGQAVLAHRLRQPRFDRPQAILHVYLRKLGIRPRLEGDGDLRRARGVGRGFEIQQVLDAREFALDQPQHGIAHRLRRRAGVARVDADGRRGDRGVAGDGEARQGDHPHQDDEQGDDPGEDRAVDEETRHSGGTPCPSACGEAGRPPFARRDDRPVLQTFPSLDHDPLAGFQSAADAIATFDQFAQFHRYGTHGIAVADHPHLRPAADAGDGLLRHQQGVGVAGTRNPGAHEHAGQKIPSGVVHEYAEEHVSRAGIDADTGKQNTAADVVGRAVLAEDFGR
ncbi:hypothetical protein KL86APRO_11312 [uncultured Alphaproteobacteria bacterium]|uniref:Uncharacterized protein n=1 Tax=uncultured Alphaproteobacteria bacterium TaxID=91750 RepID=A0A212JME1_9PROT|nr:hypothetical protein KL86APRO_11312 [uncultured Alphaproteobacteria bacterium]